MSRVRASASATRRRVDGDPPPAPLLRDVGRRAAAAGRVEDEVAGVGGHQDAALDDLRVGLDDVDLVDRRIRDLQCRPRCCSAGSTGSRRDSGRSRSVLPVGMTRSRSHQVASSRLVRLPARLCSGGKSLPSNSTGNTVVCPSRIVCDVRLSGSKHSTPSDSRVVDSLCASCVDAFRLAVSTIVYRAAACTTDAFVAIQLPVLHASLSFAYQRM